VRVPTGIALGTCSHTGLVRGGNEDDFLLASAPAGGGAGGEGFLAAIADGMGGVAGGAEASRTALRALGASLVDGDVGEGDDDDAMAVAFRAASARVYEASTAVPALRDMGTTLTAMWITADGLCVGHVGDTRVYRLRDGACESLMTDHALREGESMLTRCIGGGQLSTEVDVERFEPRPGDRYVLVTDGVWNVVPPDVFAQVAQRGEAQQVAERLVQRALDHGGPDNATCLVVDILAGGLGADSRDVELLRHERPEARALWPRAVSLRPPLWPWLVLAASALVLSWSLLVLLGVDVAGWFD